MTICNCEWCFNQDRGYDETIMTGFTHMLIIDKHLGMDHGRFHKIRFATQSWLAAITGTNPIQDVSSVAMYFDARIVE